MRRVVRLRSAFAVAAIALLMPACGAGESELEAGVAGVGSSPGSSGSASPAPEREGVMAAWRGDFDAMVERRVVRVATTFSRTNYFLDAGQPRGLLHEGMMEFEKRSST